MMKNPMLSLWMSGANAVWGHARSRGIAEARRQSAIVLAESTRQMMRFWTGGLVAQPIRKKKRPPRVR